MKKKSLFLTHVLALCLKETRQILRDKSAILLGVVLPVILIVLFGYGLSFDVKNIRLGVVTADNTAYASEALTALSHNKTFVVSAYRTRVQGEAALQAFDIEALLLFEKNKGHEAQLIIDGIDAPRATMVGNAVTGALLGVGGEGAAAGINVISRIWFNESAESRWYLVPGLIVIILTMTGTMLTGLVLAREWERGTMEAMMATPITPLEWLLSKIIPYFALAMLGWGLCMAAAIFWYGVPLRGSFWLILAASLLYLTVSLAIGLVISGVTKSQFLASQVSLLVSFLPALLLSGFIFDLRSAPVWAEKLAYLLPPVYFMELLKVGFLTGGMAEMVFKNFLVLTGYALLLLYLAYRQCQKGFAYEWPLSTLSGARA